MRKGQKKLFKPIFFLLDLTRVGKFNLRTRLTQTLIVIRAKSFHKFYLIIAALVSFLIIFIYMYFSYPVKELNDHYPHVKPIDNEQVVYELKKHPPPGWRRLSEISEKARWAIVLSEDWAFFQHSGVDFNQLKVAVTEIFTQGKFRGASTITQQVIKNIYLSSNRSLWRKIHEMILARRLERELTKQRILEIYLNCIEYGPGLYGVDMASLHYFNQSPGELGAREGAFLAMLLPSPKVYYSSFKNRRLTPYAKQKMQSTLIKLRQAKIISTADQKVEESRRFNWEK
jgi:monofunctional glycosyltransferase